MDRGCVRKDERTEGSAVMEKLLKIPESQWALFNDLSNGSFCCIKVPTGKPHGKIRGLYGNNCVLLLFFLISNDF